MKRPDTKTVTVRRVEPKPKVERVGPKKAMVTSLADALWVISQASCSYDHGWKPIPEMYDRIACTDMAWRAGFDRFDDDDVRQETVPWSPKCDGCLSHARAALVAAGVPEARQREAFKTAGAKWRWATQEKREARALADTGEMVVDCNGRLTTDKNVRTRERLIAARIRGADQQVANLERAAKEKSRRMVRSGEVEDEVTGE